MADNFQAKDATGASLTFASTQAGVIHYPVHYAIQYADQVYAVAPKIKTDGTNSLLPFCRISTAGNNAAVIKSSLGQIGTIVATNNHATDKAYLKIYDMASLPTVGTSVPVQVFCLAEMGGGVSISFPTGLRFNSGIAIAITNSMENIAATVAANQVAVSIGYQ